MGRSVSTPTDASAVCYGYLDLSDDASDEFDDIVFTVRAQFAAAFPSMTECDAWLDREDHALLRNRFAHIGVSEYCGVVALWIAPVDADWRDGAGWEALRDRWLAQVDATFRRIATCCVPSPMTRVGCFSNGQSVYQRIKETA